VTAVVSEPRLVRPVLVAVLELERPSAFGVDPGKKATPRATHPPGKGCHRDADPVGIIVVTIAVRCAAELPHGRQHLAHSLEQSRFSELKVGGVSIIPVVQALDDDTHMGQVDDSADPTGVQQSIRPLSPNAT
jgi:hypothetical protein